MQQKARAMTDTRREQGKGDAVAQNHTKRKTQKYYFRKEQKNLHVYFHQKLMEERSPKGIRIV